MKTTIVLAAGLLAGAVAAEAQSRGRDYTAPRSATVDAARARTVLIEAEAGTLRIEGRSGITEVRVTGTAYSTDRDELEEIGLTARREGDDVRVVVRIPEHNQGFGNHSHGLDLVIEVPSDLAVEAVDGSGDAEVRGVASLRMQDGSGSLEIADIGGAVRVTDGSGDVRLRDIRGDLWVEDGSGDVIVRDVTGSLEVAADGSGGIEVTGVRGSVRVRDDGSGSIRVADVGGDFVVDQDGSGGIRHENVRGAVRIPGRGRGHVERPDR
jgi:hypothetical protein